MEDRRAISAAAALPVEQVAEGSEAVHALAVAAGGAGKMKIFFTTSLRDAGGIKMVRSITRLKNSLTSILLVGVLTLVFAGQDALAATAPKQKTFGTPEEGVAALVKATKEKDTKPLLENPWAGREIVCRDRRSG